MYVQHHNDYHYSNNPNLTMKYLISAISLCSLFVDIASAFSMASTFGGTVLVTGSAESSPTTHGSTIEMRKGKDNVPPAMRAQYKRQKEMQGMREQMMEAQRPGADGLPVFNLFVRTPRANVRSTNFLYLFIS